MPEIFMAVDTTNYSDYYRALARKDVFRSFIVEYVDRNRTRILSEYKTFEDFYKRFEFSSADIKSFIKKGEDSGIKYIENQYNRSKDEMFLILKALVASNIWQTNEYYRIVNQSDDVIRKAVEIISDPVTYDKILGKN